MLRLYSTLWIFSLSYKENLRAFWYTSSVVWLFYLPFTVFISIIRTSILEPELENRKWLFKAQPRLYHIHIGIEDFVHSIQITHKNTDNNILFIKFQWQTVMFLYWLLNGGISFINTLCKMIYSIHYTAGPGSHWPLIGKIT
jgi:hypothetical protein